MDPRIRHIFNRGDEAAETIVFPECDMYEQCDDSLLMVWTISSDCYIQEQFTFIEKDTWEACNPPLLWSPHNATVDSLFKSPTVTNSVDDANNDDVVICFDRDQGIVHTNKLKSSNGNAVQHGLHGMFDLKIDDYSPDNIFDSAYKESLLKIEHSTIPALSKLYNPRQSKFDASFTVDIAGKSRTLKAYHLPEVCFIAKDNRSFIEETQLHYVLYRWHLKGAIIIKTEARGASFVNRLYYSCCLIRSDETDDLYVLLAIMTTLCVTSRADFLVLNLRNQMTFYWQGHDNIKHFYCIPSIKFDTDKADHIRDRFFDIHSWKYDERRMMPIDTHDPSNRNMNNTVDSTLLEKRFHDWTIIPGLRRVVPDVTQDASSNTLARTSSRLADIVAASVSSPSVVSNSTSDKAVSNKKQAPKQSLATQLKQSIAARKRNDKTSVVSSLPPLNIVVPKRLNLSPVTSNSTSTFSDNQLAIIKSMLTTNQIRTDAPLTKKVKYDEDLQIDNLNAEKVNELLQVKNDIAAEKSRLKLNRLQVELDEQIKAQELINDAKKVKYENETELKLHKEVTYMQHVLDRKRLLAQCM